ncbi:hypothetical protein PR202_ga16390 [Eleusine coracana subsp. coracana]|uniref:Uncharacterized protein n=1 Tax=Eleusine coracana subsp. coracana TaxID=191504 RepID=A0AAV5CMP1_ELECO|nr:hypothetical protein PR202_ga16390 [Eleusine coracana subsp. coracana]
MGADLGGGRGGSRGYGRGEQRAGGPSGSRGGGCALTAEAVGGVYYIQKDLLFPPPPFPTTSALLDHLEASLADVLAIYYPVTGRFAIDERHDDGWSVSIDCSGQGAELLHAIMDNDGVIDVVPPYANDNVPACLVRSFFPLNHAVNKFDGCEFPLFAVQVTDLHDGMFLGFLYNHALSDGTMF